MCAGTCHAVQSACAADTHMGPSGSSANPYNSSSSANPYTPSPGHEQVYGQSGHVTQGVYHALTAWAVASRLPGAAPLSKQVSLAT